ncbi:MAG: chalcone isomerase family protein [Polyangiales bacterium]
MRSIPAVLAALALVATPASTTHARECLGVRLPDRVSVEGTTLVLNGMGVREATVFQVDVYVAALYLEQRSNDAAAILGTEAKRRVIMHFVRDVGRDDAREGIEGGMRRNSPDVYPSLRPRIARMLRLLDNVREGDEVVITYVPGRGTEIVTDHGREVIEGADFGRAVFASWIGPRPPNPGLRSGLLGGRCR